MYDVVFYVGFMGNSIEIECFCEVCCDWFFVINMFVCFNGVFE